MAKKRRNRNGPPKGAVFLYENSPASKWINQWSPPKGSAAFFFRGSDAEFARKHPVGYFFLVVLGIAALFLPCAAYAVYTLLVLSAESPWQFLGMFGAFIIGIGLFNFVAIIIKQYLGHLVSIVSFLAGGVLIAISLLFL